MIHFNGLKNSSFASCDLIVPNVGIGTTAPTYQLQLSTDSAAKPGTSTWTIASDVRLKDIRAPFTRGLDDLMGLNTIYFNYKKNNPLGLPSDKEYVGIKAQDAQKAIPEAVSIDDKGFLHVTNDSIIWTAVNAIKELYAKFKRHDEHFALHDREIAAVEASKADKAATERSIASMKADSERSIASMKADSERSIASVKAESEAKVLKLEARASKAEQENAALKARLDNIERMLRAH